MIKNAILNSAVATPSLSGKVATGGRLNVYNAIRSSNFVYLDREQYGASGLVTVTVSHAAANVNAGSADTVTVSMSSQTESGVTITLTETGVNTGIFSGTIQLAPGAATSDSLLQVSLPDLITATYTTLGLTDTAIVDGTPPVIKNITATPSATSAVITWNTDKLATSEVIYGTSPFSLTSTGSSAGVHLSHSVTLTGLSPNTAYFYRVVTTDETGNQAVSPIQAFATLSILPKILLVDDDHGDVLEKYFIAALNANSLTYDVWDAFALGTTPNTADLTRYEMVIWNTGYDYLSATRGIRPEEEAAISSYLDGGGRIFISGQDILKNGVSSSFQQNYLKVANVTNNILELSHVETGVIGHPIGDNLVLKVSAPPEFPSLFVDAVEPTSDANGFLRHGFTLALYPFSAVSYHGNYSARGFGMVFSTVPFESISATDAAPNNSKEVMRRIVDYLLGRGTVNIERTAYNPHDQVLLTVADSVANLNDLTTDTVVVNVYSITETTPIPMVLTETGPATGIFEGYVQLAPGPAVANDGILQVVHDDFIVADYAGGASIDFARVDAIPPTASNIVSAR